MILGIHHIAISTPDIERLTCFYRDIIGFDVVSQAEWEKGTRPEADLIMGLRGTAARMAMLRAENCFIELFEFRSPCPAIKNPAWPVNNHGYTHLCLRVTDLAKEYERLIAAGVAFHCPPQNLKTHAATYARDPDGNVIELLELFEPSHPWEITGIK